MRKRVKLVIFIAIILLIIVVIAFFKAYYDEAYRAVSIYSLNVDRIVYFRGNMSLYIYVEIVFRNNALSKIIINYINARVYLLIGNEKLYLGDTIIDPPVLVHGLNNVNRTLILSIDKIIENDVIRLVNESSAQLYLILEYGYTYGTLNVVKMEDVYSKPFAPYLMTSIQ